MSELWKNWDKSLRCEFETYFQPHTVQDVQDIVRRANEKKKTLRVVGAGHSWSKLVPTNDWIMNLDNLNRITSIDRTTDTVEVEAGIRLASLYSQLNAQGIAMRNLGAITSQSIAGAISTGTHGTGLEYGCLGTLVDGITVVDGQGELQRFTLADHPEMMRALRLNLGCLGIIVSVRLNCTANHNVLLHTYSTSFENALRELSDLYTRNERVRIYWLPGSSKVFIHTMNRTSAADDPGPVMPWAEAVLLRDVLMGTIWRMGNSYPQTIAFLDKLIELGYRDKRVIGPVNEAITTPMPPYHQEAESAVPLADAVNALEAFDKMARDKGLRVNVPAEIRFVRGDDLMLSPCNNGDVCYIGAYSASRADESELFEGFKEIMDEFKGRPHWGKINAPTRSQAQQMYPDFARFGQIREEQDPQCIFVNNYIRELFL